MADTQDALPSDGGSPIPGDAPSGVTGAIWGDFTIERKIGGGGMGAVYLARQAGLDRKVALKVLPADLGNAPEYRQRFSAEAKAAGRISSPNVVAVYACGEHAGRLWYAMEYVEGQDLAVRLKAGWHPDWREALRLAAQAARGLAAAHRLGLVHRDVKPANLMLAHDGTLKVADFGLVRGRQDTITTTGAVVGTMTYIAPEQAQGAACDNRADLYALGCVLYELLCKRPPFTGDTMANLIAQHLQAVPFPPSRHAPWLPRIVDDLVLRLLAKKPEGRPADAARLANDLDRLSQAGAAGPRRGTSPMLVAALVVAAVAAAGWWYWPRWQAAQQPPPPVVAPVPKPVAPPKPVPPPEPAPASGTEPIVSPVPPAKPAEPVRDAAAIERQAAALIATGEHLGPAEDLRKRLGKPDLVDHQGARELWAYGRFTFIIEDGLVLNVREH